MTFRPTILPFQLQRRLNTVYPWGTVVGGRYPTLEAALAGLEAATVADRYHAEYRVHCDPKDVSRALHEAGILIRELHEYASRG